MKIGFIGMGIIGGITEKIISKAHKTFPYDKYKGPYNNQENFEQLVKNSEVIFICVPTPMKLSGEIDYSSIYHSLNSLQETAKMLKRSPKDILVVIRSTAVSGTSDRFEEQYDFRFAVNPEFLREKHALEDMENTKRIIIGANNKENAEKLVEVYKPLFPNAQYIIVDGKTAEMIKYASNVFLASQIGIANEIYNICQVVDVNYDAVKNAVLLDKRIARNIDVPGTDGDFGFGGKCFPKDLNALIYLAREKMYRPYLLEEVWRLNEKARKNKDWLEIPGATSENNNKPKNKK